MRNPKPISVVAVAIFLFIFGLLSIPIGILAIAFVPLMSSTDEELAAAFLIFIFGIADLVAAYGLWTGQTWARFFTILLLVLSILVTPLFVDDKASDLEIDVTIIGNVLNVAMILMLWSKNVGEWLKNADR